MKVHNVMVTEPSQKIVVSTMSCYDACCYDKENLKPRWPKVNCPLEKKAHSKEFELFNEKILQKLADNKKKIMKERKLDAAKQKEEVSEYRWV